MNFKNLPEGGLRKNKMARKELPRAKKRTDALKINENLVPNVAKIANGLEKIVELMNVHKNYIERSTEIGGPIYNKADVDEMKEEYNKLIAEIAALSFTPYIIS